MWKRGAAFLTALLMLFSCALAEDVYLDEPTPGAAEETADDTLTARDDLINRIIALGQELYIKANGKSQRAHYKGDIYVCKNFTTYLFRQNRDDFCMAEYPDVQLLVPNNGRTQRHHARLRSGDGRNPLDGQQHARRQEERHPLRLGAVRRGEERRVVGEYILQENTRRDALPSAR